MASGKLKFVRLNQAAAGTQTIEAAPGAGLKHVVVGFGLVTTVATAIPQFESPAATLIAGPFGGAAGAFCGGAGSAAEPLFEGAANGALLLVSAGVGGASGWITYFTTTT